jgi:hypothetical protein
VPGQWQGEFSRLRVIGDKKAGASTGQLSRDPSLLDRLRETVKVPLRVVHVVRNPYDNIATMQRRDRWRADRTLESSADLYFELAEAVEALRARVAAEEWIDLVHEDFVDDAEAAVRRLCGFVGLEPAESYVRDCAATVLPSPKRTRDGLPWSPELVESVQARCRAIPVLDRYASAPFLPALDAASAEPT